jgi:GntR family transcriptional regulator, transcriptional repressor for pyruvate dehydrogenase complex
METGGRKYSGGLTQQVVAHISSLIDSGSLTPGEKLPSESEIVRREGVSRTVVREAISKLQAAGRVATRHGIGTFVLEHADRGDFGLERSAINTAGDVLAILEVRIGIETEAAALAAMRRTSSHLEAMKLAMEAFTEEIHAGRCAVDPDFQFHLGIAKAAGNRYFSDILNSLGPKVIPRSRFQIDEQEPQRQEYLKRINNEHEDIYSAILRADPEASRAAVRNHLGNSRERMRRASEITKAARKGSEKKSGVESR